MMRWLTPVRATAALFAAVTVLGAPYSWATPVFTGPTSPYYLDDFLAHTIYVAQGATIINSFPVTAYTPQCLGDCESNLAVTDVVSTNWFGRGNSGSSSNGGQYARNGVPTGTSWQGTPPPNNERGDSLYDGTSDGSHNYAVEYTSSAFTESVIQTDLNWQNAHLKPSSQGKTGHGWQSCEIIMIGAMSQLTSRIVIDKRSGETG